MPNRSNWRA